MRLANVGARAALFLMLSAGVGGAGCSQSPDTRRGSPDLERTSSTGQAIQNGSLDGAAHPFAVGVCIGQKGQCEGFCSGALILPNLVVTARHCVDETPKVIDCDANPTFGARNSQMWITTNSNMMQSTSGWHEVTAVSVPSDDHVCGHDIALLVLNGVVPGAEAKPITPGVQYAMSDFNRYPAERVTAIGFGNAGPEGTPFTAGTRRIKQGIQTLCIPGDQFIPCPPGFNDNEFYTDDGVCEGDSGSSAYDNPTLATAPLSFGVLSRGGDNRGDAGQPATLCKGGLYTRLDKFRDLVVDAATAASNNWKLYPKPVPDWTIYVPPPPDAGAPDAGPKTPKPRDNGVQCDTNDQCKSKVCADTGAGKACTDACDESAAEPTCEDGFFCQDSVCVQGAAAPPPAAPKTETTTSGCSVVGPGAHGADRPLFAVGLGAMLGLILAARRRREG